MCVLKEESEMESDEENHQQYRSDVSGTVEDMVMTQYFKITSVGISFVNSVPLEFLSCHLHTVDIKISSSDSESFYKVQSKDIHIDNQLHTATFPVTVQCSSLSGDNGHSKPVIHLSAAQVILDSPMLIASDSFPF